MRFAIFLLICLLLGYGLSAHATSFGRVDWGVIVSIDHKPAICLPKDAKEDMPVGWISITESYVKNPESWALDLKPNAKPTVLLPGDCMVYGVVPDGYKAPQYKQAIKPLRLKVNRTYSFQLNHAYRPRDRYTAVFCIGQNADGSLEYLQYTPGGGEVVPSCDAKRNGNVSEQIVPTN